MEGGSGSFARGVSDARRFVIFFPMVIPTALAATGGMSLVTANIVFSVGSTLICLIGGIFS